MHGHRVHKGLIQIAWLKRGRLSIWEMWAGTLICKGRNALAPFGEEQGNEMREWSNEEREDCLYDEGGRQRRDKTHWEDEDAKNYRMSLYFTLHKTASMCKSNKNLMSSISNNLCCLHMFTQGFRWPPPALGLFCWIPFQYLLLTVMFSRDCSLALYYQLPLCYIHTSL